MCPLYIPVFENIRAFWFVQGNNVPEMLVTPIRPPAPVFTPPQDLSPPANRTAPERRAALTPSPPAAAAPAKKPRQDTDWKHIHVAGKHNIRCEICFSMQDVVKRFSGNNKLSTVAQAGGTRYRSNVIDSHVRTPMHTEAAKARRMRALTHDLQVVQQSPMLSAISEANRSLANHIGKLMHHVYLSAKRLTLSARSFPARVAVGAAANAYECRSAPFIWRQVGLQHTTPNVTPRADELYRPRPQAGLQGDAAHLFSDFAPL